MAIDEMLLVSGVYAITVQVNYKDENGKNITGESVFQGTVLLIRR